MPQPATAPGYQRYQPQDGKITIQFSLAAQERLLTEVMTGFGAIPRRGAEVGGLLLGRVEPGTVWVDDVIPAACEHRRGPSFLLSEKDHELLEDEFARAAANDGPKPVGMFRSNTRDHDSISEEDRTLFGKYFPAPSGVFLLIRPFATKAPTGTFLTYKDGALADTSDDVFQFGRPELEMGLPRRRPLGEPRAARTQLDGLAEVRRPVEEPLPTAPAPPAAAYSGASPSDSKYAYSVATGAGSHRRRSWLWIPLSFIFLLLGVLLGFQAAITFYPKPAAAGAGALSLGLTSFRRGDNLHIRWNRESLAIRNAQSGKLEIEDGQYRKSVDLDAAALQNGSVIYPPLSANVNLRFEITVSGGTQVIEKVAWSKTTQ